MSDILKNKEYINQVTLILLIEKLSTINKSKSVKEIKEDLVIFFNKFYENVNYKEMSENDSLDINEISTKTVENCIEFLKQNNILKLGITSLDFSVDYVENYELYIKGNPNSSMRDFFKEELQNFGIKFAYENKLLLLTPSKETQENLEIQKDIIKEGLLEEVNLIKILEGKKVIKNEELIKLIESSRNTNNSIEEDLTVVKNNLKSFLLKNKSFKTKTLDYNNLNFLKWSFSSKREQKEQFLSFLNVENIEKNKSIVLDNNLDIKLYALLSDQKSLIEKLRTEIFKNVNLSDEEFSKLQTIVSDDYILEVVKDNYNGNFIDFLSEINNEELNPIPYEEMENFKLSLSKITNKIKRMNIDSKEKIVFVIDALDMDGRSCETLCEIMRNELLAMYKNINPEQLVVMPSLNPKKDERGFNLTTIEHLYKNDLIKENDKITFITADNGINNIKSIKNIKSFAESKKFIVDDFIITDHHILINNEIKDEPNTITVNQAEDSNYHLFEGYNSCGAYLLKEIFNFTLKELKVEQDKYKRISKIFDKIGMNANKADLVTAKERISTDSKLDNYINKMNAIFSSHILYVLSAKYKDGIKSKQYVLEKIKELYSIDYDEIAEEVLNKTVFILDRTNNLYSLYKEIILNDNTLTSQEIAAEILNDNNLPTLEKTGDPVVYNLIKMKLTDFAMEDVTFEQNYIFEEVNNLITNVKELEKSLLKYKSQKMDLSDIDILDVLDFKNIIIFNIGNNLEAGEELSRKSWNKIFKLNPDMPKNISDKDVVMVGAFDKNDGKFKGSIRTKSTEYSTFEVLYQYKKEDKANVLGHHNAAGFELKLETNNPSSELKKIAKTINTSVGQLNRRNKGKQSDGYLLEETKDLKIFNTINNLTKANSSPQNKNIPIAIKADKIVFKNPNDLKNDRYSIQINNSSEIEEGYYIASILFGDPEINVLISASDLSSVKKNDYLLMKQMSNGTFMVTATGDAKYLKLSNFKTLELNENTVEHEHGKEYWIKELSQDTVRIDFESMIRHSKYYQFEEDKSKIEFHLDFFRKVIEKYKVLNVLDLEANGLGRLSEIINIGIANLKFDENKKLVLDISKLFVKQDNILNSIQNLCHLYQDFLNKEGVDPIEAKDRVHEIMKDNKDGLFIAHNLLNFDIRVSESVFDVSDYTDNILDSMYPIREKNVAMDENDNTVNVVLGNKTLNGNFSLYNQNYTLETFVKEVDNGRWYDVVGKRYLEKRDSKLFYFDKATNIREELEIENFNLKSYKLRAKSSVQRLGKLQIITNMRDKIEYPLEINDIVNSNLLKNGKIEFSFESKHDGTAVDLLDEKMLTEIIDLYDLRFSLEDNIEKILKHLETKYEKNFLPEENLKRMSDIIIQIKNEKMEQVRLYDKEPMLLYKYVNVDELLHSLELFNSNNNDKMNVQKILRNTNMSERTAEAFLSRLEPYKELLHTYEETHNNTFNIYSDHVQEFYMLVVKTLIDKLNPEVNNLDKMVEMLDYYVQDSKSKYYYYRKHSEEFKPVAFNKFMFKQLVQQIELKDDNDIINKRLNELIEILRSGKIIINVDKDKIFEVNYKDNFDLNKVADVLERKIDYDRELMGQFMEVVKELAEVTDKKVKLSKVSRYFSEESLGTNFNLAIDQNKNRKDSLIPELKEEESYQATNKEYLKDIIKKCNKLIKVYNIAVSYQDEMDAIEKRTDMTEDEKFSRTSELQRNYLELHENIQDKQFKTKPDGKIKKLSTIVNAFSNSILYLDSQDYFINMKNEINIKERKLNITDEDVIEKDISQKEIVKELVQKNNLKTYMFSILEPEKQVEVLNIYIDYVNFMNPEMKPFAKVENFNDFLILETEDNSINYLKQEIEKILSGEKIRSGSLSGRINDPIKFLLETTRKEMKLKPKLLDARLANDLRIAEENIIDIDIIEEVEDNKKTQKVSKLKR